MGGSCACPLTEALTGATGRNRNEGARMRRALRRLLHMGARGDAAERGSGG